MTDGRLALVFDDGYAEDHDEIRPVLESAGVPAVFAVVPAWLGDPGHLSTDELAELVDAGCEVAAHGRRHRYLQAHRLGRDAAAGDERLVLDSDHVFPDDDAGVVVGDDFEVVDGEGRETVAVTGKGTDGDAPHLDLATPLGTGFDVGETVVRPARSVLRDEVLGAREALREAGFDPTTFVFPYDAADVRAWSLAAEQYDAVANAAVRSLPNPPGTDPTNLRRWYLETSHLTRPEVGDYLDAVAEQGGIGVLAGHSSWDTLPPERVEAVVEAARQRGVAVTTFDRLSGR